METRTPPVTGSPVQRQPYQPPGLERLGDVRQRTLGGSGCVSESTNLRVPTGGCPTP